MLTYKTFDELMASVEGDLEKYALAGLIDRASLIKAARYVNADLGLRLNKREEILLEVVNYKTDLPKDFHSAICMVGYNCTYLGSLGQGGIHGTHMRDLTKEYVKRKFPCDAWLNCHTSDYLIQTFKERQIFTTTVTPIQASKSSFKKFCKDSPNKVWISEYTVDVKEEEILTNFKEGQIHLTYMLDLVDEEGNLLVLDHELTDKYYEYEIKSKIFEKLYLDYGEDVRQKWMDIRDILLPKAKGEARNIVTTPEYKQMKAYNLKMLADYHREFIAPFI